MNAKITLEQMVQDVNWSEFICGPDVYKAIFLHDVPVKYKNIIFVRLFKWTRIRVTS